MSSSMTFAIEGHSKTRYVVKQGPLNLSRKFLLQFSQTQNSESNRLNVIIMSQTSLRFRCKNAKKSTQLAR